MRGNIEICIWCDEEFCMNCSDACTPGFCSQECEEAYEEDQNEEDDEDEDEEPSNT